MQEITALHQKLSDIQTTLLRLDARERPAVMYHLGEKPPFAMVRYSDGRTFKIWKDGRTSMMFGDLEAHIPGACPEPSALWWLNAWSWLWNRRRHIPAVLMLAGILFCLQVIFAGTPGAVSSVWFLDFFATMMNTALVSLGLLCILAAALYNFGRGVRVQFAEREQPAGLLSANNSRSGISPHVLVCSESEHEDSLLFAERIREQMNRIAPRGQYLVAFAFRDPTGVIVRHPETGEQILFRRDALTKHLDGWGQEVCTPRRFDGETFPQFVEYVDAFCDQFREWVSLDLKRDNPLQNWTAELIAAGRKAAMCVALLLLASFGASAQSAVPVPEERRDGIERVRHSIAPDSAATASRIAELERNLEEAKREIWGFTVQAWGFVRRVVENLFYLLLCCAGLTRYAAEAANNEQRINYFGGRIYGGWVSGFGNFMTAVTFFLTITIMLVFLIDVFIRAVCGQLSGLLGLFFSWEFVGVLGWFGLLRLAGRFTDWFVPNPKVMHPGSRPGLGGGNGFKQIG